MDRVKCAACDWDACTIAIRTNGVRLLCMRCLGYEGIEDGDLYVRLIDVISVWKDGKWQ